MMKIDPLTGRAVISIKTFFAKKRWWCGGPIPKSVLLTRSHINMVINLSLIRAIDIGYSAIRRSKMLARTDKTKKNSDIRLCVSILHECERLGIPQRFIGGLFLLYLKLCEKAEL
jgi:hypothetical protein